MWFQKKKTDAVTDERAMQDVMLLLDEWKSPEPSPWFDARMMARFREEQQRAPESLFDRLRDRWLLNQQAVAKPLMAGALALLLVAGGGGYWQMSQMHNSKPAGISATVEDLQLIDNNAQAIQTMDQLLDDNDNDDPPLS